MVIDVSHTAHTRARTGIQRVTRSLVRVLPEATPITYDPWARAWRGLRGWEQANLTEDRPGSPRRGAAWPWWAKAQGTLARWAARRRAPDVRRVPPARALLVPEIFSADVGRALVNLAPAVRGPRVAVFHDAIALQLPEFSPPATVARFPRYLQELASFDAIAAVSEDSRACLQEFWQWSGVRAQPPIYAVPNGIDVPGEPPALPPLDRFQVFSVGTLEGRKNHLALLEACERLWQEGLAFNLTLVGHAHKTTGRSAVERVRQLQAAGRPLVYLGSISDADLEAAYASAHLTIYPSLYEGFGLPVLESLARGRPCVCSAHGALGEAARGGGCLTVAEPTAYALAAALRQLVGGTETWQRLANEARTRTFRTWQDYRSDLLALIAQHSAHQ